MSEIIATNGIITLSELKTSDAPFIYDLMNDPSYILNIGDRGIKTIDDAKSYLIDGPISSYEHYGFGLWKVSTNESQQSIGICGLLQRDYLDCPDIGYATLSAFRNQGLTSQAVQLTLSYFRQHIKSERLYGLTKPENATSQHLLIKANFNHLETKIINGLNTSLFQYLM